MEISKEEFQAYEDVRASCVVNMTAINIVCQISGLKREKVLYIMENYGRIKGKEINPFPKQTT